MLQPGEVELGLGVHGEPGIRKWNFTNNSDLINELFPLVNRRLNLTSNDKVLLLINNLGGMTEIEVLNLMDPIQKQIKATGAKIARIGNGHVMTSLDMAGLNFTVLKLTENSQKWIDADTEMLGWPKVTIPGGQIEPKSLKGGSSNQKVDAGVVCDLVKIKKIITFVCNELIKEEVALNDLDAITGDGDCGSTVKLGCEGVLKIIGTSKAVNYSGLVFDIGSVLEEEMGGSSGSLLSILFTAIAADIRLAREDTSLGMISRAFKSGIDEMMHVGRAQQGDRTMLDALIPAQEALQAAGEGNLTEAIQSAATAAAKGAEKTATMVAKAGRAAYCKDRNEDSNPDAGAVMIAKLFAALQKA